MCLYLVSSVLLTISSTWFPLPIYRVSLVAQTVKNLPANWASHVAQWPRIYLLMQKMKEIWVQFLGQEDPLG